MTLSPDHSFSPSQINMGTECPFRWNSYIRRQPTIKTETIYADVGTIIHQSIADYYEVISPRPQSGTIEGTFEQILDRNWKTSGIKGLVSRKKKCLDNFLKFEKKRLRTWKQYKPSLTEGKLKARINGITYTTIVDAYWEEDATIIDWKTGNVNKIGTSEKIQGQVMKMAIEAYGKPVERVIFVALRLGLELEMPKMTTGFVEGAVQRLIEYDRMQDFPKRKSRNCWFCQYQLRCALGGRCLWM